MFASIRTTPLRIARFLRVSVDGVDVTNRCFAADETSGRAWCYKVDENGRFMLDFSKPKTRVASEVLRGKVELIDTRNSPSAISHQP